MASGTLTGYEINTTTGASTPVSIPWSNNSTHIEISTSSYGIPVYWNNISNYMVSRTNSFDINTTYNASAFSKVNNAFHAYYGCTAMTGKPWIPENPCDIRAMYALCKNITIPVFPKQPDGYSMKGIYQQCTKLYGVVDLTGWQNDIPNAQIDGMFLGCNNIWMYAPTSTNLGGPSNFFVYAQNVFPKTTSTWWTWQYGSDTHGSYRYAVGGNIRVYGDYK